MTIMFFLLLLLLAALTVLLGGFAVFTGVKIFISIRDRGGVHTVWSLRTCAAMAVVGCMCGALCVDLSIQLVDFILSEKILSQLLAGLEGRPLTVFLLGTAFGILLSAVFAYLRRHSGQGLLSRKEQ
ncbi:MAG: hypothetical protein IJ874_06705 [Ruminococcus sp.]|nr:hypothetical protein [Ruminococcus sp.]